MSNHLSPLWQPSLFKIDTKKYPSPNQANLGRDNNLKTKSVDVSTLQYGANPDTTLPRVDVGAGPLSAPPHKMDFLGLANSSEEVKSIDSTGVLESQNTSLQHSIKNEQFSKTGIEAKVNLTSHLENVKDSFDSYKNSWEKLRNKIIKVSETWHVNDHQIQDYKSLLSDQKLTLIELMVNLHITTGKNEVGSEVFEDILEDINGDIDSISDINEAIELVTNNGRNTNYLYSRIIGHEHSIYHAMEDGWEIVKGEMNLDWPSNVQTLRNKTIKLEQKIKELQKENDDCIKLINTIKISQAKLQHEFHANTAKRLLELPGDSSNDEKGLLPVEKSLKLHVNEYKQAISEMDYNLFDEFNIDEFNSDESYVYSFELDISVPERILEDIKGDLEPESRDDMMSFNEHLGISRNDIIGIKQNGLSYFGDYDKSKKECDELKKFYSDEKTKLEKEINKKYSALEKKTSLSLIGREEHGAATVNINKNTISSAQGGVETKTGVNTSNVSADIVSSNNEVAKIEEQIAQLVSEHEVCAQAIKDVENHKLLLSMDLYYSSIKNFVRLKFLNSGQVKSLSGIKKEIYQKVILFLEKSDAKITRDISQINENLDSLRAFLHDIPPLKKV